MEVADAPIRVQSIAQEDRKVVVPPEYIQPPENRPSKLGNGNATDHKIPMIDLGGDKDVNLLCEEIGRACREWGAFHVANHGVPIALLDEIRKAGTSFFEELPMAEKLRYSCDPNSPASEGYGSRMLVASDDAVLDWRDFFDHHTFPLSRRHLSRWPHSPPNYREVIAEYSDQMKVLAEKLLGLISTSLGLSSSFIEEAMGELYQNITISYYPSCPQPELTLGLQSHSDMGFITLLIQDKVAGLQVSKDGEWVTVDPVSHAILVILGDQTEHRAITNANRARLSVATFHDPAKTMSVSPAFKPPRYRQVIYGDYVSSWYTKGPNGKRNIDALLI
ncbi:Non-heme dioxygenase N-terminal domain-containing protein [Cynara cardunculus var. scolymus]|uniref:Non-heme dioxygenase N-terminal domain-containing protein n=1 Tax=Cynara cardunculus var. scolymus TaxID=59895 RepID=A0A103XRN7_CYNCS|nr:Non-heme dioxygenase N-terminal domain-containing protein [Cynara cardunculus var. scolymus]